MSIIRQQGHFGNHIFIPITQTQHHNTFHLFNFYNMFRQFVSTPIRQNHSTINRKVYLIVFYTAYFTARQASSDNMAYLHCMLGKKSTTDTQNM
jgi:hypothetical protein